MSLSLDPLPQHRGGAGAGGSAKRPRASEEDEDAVADEAENRIQRAIDAAASTRKPRKRKKKSKPVWPEGVDADDAFPVNGRFSQEQEDDFDRQCVQRPLTAALTFENKQALRADAVERIRQRSMRGAHGEQEERMEDDESMSKEGADAVAAMDEMMRTMAINDGKEADDLQLIRTRNALSTDLLRDVRHVKGDTRLAAIRQCLNNMGYTRSTFQMIFHDNFIQVPQKTHTHTHTRNCRARAIAPAVY